MEALKDLEARAALISGWGAGKLVWHVPTNWQLFPSCESQLPSTTDQWIAPAATVTRASARIAYSTTHSPESTTSPPHHCSAFLSQLRHSSPFRLNFASPSSAYELFARYPSSPIVSPARRRLLILGFALASRPVPILPQNIKLAYPASPSSAGH
ncbi:hypothetical protein BT63DRAFT_455481 [Microthyrium microscopicum]|uniref:Uncharacterized protein n=1 Tax=Microthyrium microscopicum TaxID=703497 RepID=A0A6A6UB62_9PEZI|nr:hypothetical protein BT63DRAFT_455481 [Microthyrium microscopicum]